jgi:hypothetical protein
MTPTELADLERKLAQGPHLVSDAVFGACVGGFVGWLGVAHGRHMFANVAQGACAGIIVSLATYGFNQWKADQERRQSSAVLGEHFAGALSPYPLYRASLTYPWSNR